MIQRSFLITATMVAGLASTLTGCTQGGQRYSHSPVDALRQTKAYLEQQDGYSNDSQVASLSAGRIDLGKKLFHDKRLSADGQVSCATCHDPNQGYTQNKRSVPKGTSAALGGRNAPSLYDVISRRTLFHDGRARSLEAQVTGPLLNPREMANTSMTALAARVRSYSDYDRFFRYAYGTPASVNSLVSALSAYQRTLITGPSRFDQWRYGGKSNALSAREMKGYALFIGKAGCASCHTVGAKRAPFTDGGFHRTGYELTKPVAIREADLGRFTVTGRPEDRFAFRTPTLRNVALTGPYMHDGRLKSLRAVVSFFDQQQNLGLSKEERGDLVAFLKSLTSLQRP